MLEEAVVVVVGVLSFDEAGAFTVAAAAFVPVDVVATGFEAVVVVVAATGLVAVVDLGSVVVLSYNNLVKFC